MAQSSWTTIQDKPIASCVALIAMVALGILVTETRSDVHRYERVMNHRLSDLLKIKQDTIAELDRVSKALAESIEALRASS